MKKFIFVLNFVTWTVVGSLSAQEYNEETVRKELDKYIDNPKLFYEKLKSLSEKAEKANQNTMKVSEEYLSLLDKKDSLIKIYKNQAMAAKTAKVASPTESVAVPVTTYPNTKTSASAATSVKASSPYRVQLAAFFRDDFAKFFGTFNKTLGVQKLDNRNVIEVQGFKDSLEAQEFSQKIKQLGFPGAFVAKYDENGVRQEGYQLIKGNGNSNTVAKTPTKSANYPNWVPVGYQEITNTHETVKLSPSNSTTKPTVSTPPVMRKSVTAQASVPIAVHPSSATATPKTLATVTPTSSSTPASTSKPAPAPPKAAMPTKVNTADQLDAAFDQLFKR